MPFTRKQRKWYLRVYGNRCTFHELHNGVWQRCIRREKLEVHHIVPVRWSKLWMPEFNRHACLNGILLCRGIHHFRIHPDLRLAFDQYHYNKLSFKDMVWDRDSIAAKGIPYWNTDWDWMLRYLARRFIYRHFYHNPGDTFPKRRKRRKRK